MGEYRIKHIINRDETKCKIKFFGHRDDDLVDRLNYIFTTFCILTMAVYTATRHYYYFLGAPIECWCPAHFPAKYVKYVNSYCWMRNTYFYPLTEALPSDDESRTRSEVRYYQWGPIILMMMGLLFKLPNFIWRTLYGYGGIDLRKIAMLSVESQEQVSVEDRNKVLKNIAHSIHRSLETNIPYKNNKLSRIRNVFCNKRSGTYLIGLYLFVKVLYCSNVVGQFFLLDNILGHNFFPSYGIRFFEHKNSTQFIHFPRVTMCDMEIRQLQNIQKWTIQCVLPLNMFYEKIFLFLWFWFSIVSALTVINFLFWIWRILFPNSNKKYIEKFLKNTKHWEVNENEKIIERFVDHHLRCDGVFALMMIERNTSAVFTGDLWNLYRKKRDD